MALIFNICMPLNCVPILCPYLLYVYVTIICTFLNEELIRRCIIISYRRVNIILKLTFFFFLFFIIGI